MYNPGLPNKSKEFLFLQKREQWVRSVEEDVWGEITTWMDLTLADWRAFDQSAHFLSKENLQRQCTFDDGQNITYWKPLLSIYANAKQSVIDSEVISDPGDDDVDEKVSAGRTKVVVVQSWRIIGHHSRKRKGKG